MLSPDSKGQNQSLKSAIVRVKDPQGAEQSEVTGEDGWVALNAAVGKHECEVSHPQYGKLQQTVELQGGARKLEVVLRPPPAGPAGVPGEVAVGINVSTGNGADIAKAQVTLGKTTKKTGADGTMWFKVKPGVWPYTVTADGHKKESGDIDVPDAKGPTSHVIYMKSSVE